MAFGCLSGCLLRGGAAKHARIDASKSVVSLPRSAYCLTYLKSTGSVQRRLRKRLSIVGQGNGTASNSSQRVDRGRSVHLSDDSDPAQTATNTRAVCLTTIKCSEDSVMAGSFQTVPQSTQQEPQKPSTLCFSDSNASILGLLHCSRSVRTASRTIWYVHLVVAVSQNNRGGHQV